MIDSLSHMTFVVSDLEKMEEILVTVMDAKKIYDSGENTFSVSREKFFSIAGIWVAIMEGDSLPLPTYNHVAFKISDEDYDLYLRRIRSLGLEVREGRSRVTGEGQSIYFYDNDNHMFELHTGTLEQRLKRYAQGCSEG